MANLFYGYVNTDGEYEKVADWGTGITFTTGSKYRIQCQGITVLYEGASAPEEGGFTIYGNGFFTYTAKADEYLYVKTQTSAIINIAEE